MSAADLMVRYGIDPVFLLALLWLLAAFTASLIGGHR